MENNRTVITDVHLAAFLQVHDIMPELKMQSGRVVFEFECTDALYRLMDEYNRNQAIKVIDYVDVLRCLKSQMFSMKKTPLAKAFGGTL